MKSIRFMAIVISMVMIISMSACGSSSKERGDLSSVGKIEGEYSQLTEESTAQVGTQIANVVGNYGALVGDKATQKAFLIGFSLKGDTKLQLEISPVATNGDVNVASNLGGSLDLTANVSSSHFYYEMKENEEKPTLLGNLDGKFNVKATDMIVDKMFEGAQMEKKEVSLAVTEKMFLKDLCFYFDSAITVSPKDLPTEVTASINEFNGKTKLDLVEVIGAIVGGIVDGIGNAIGGKTQENNVTTLEDVDLVPEAPQEEAFDVVEFFNVLKEFDLTLLADISENGVIMKISSGKQTFEKLKASQEIFNNVEASLFEFEVFANIGGEGVINALALSAKIKANTEIDSNGQNMKLAIDLDTAITVEANRNKPTIPEGIETDTSYVNLFKTQE